MGEISLERCNLFKQYASIESSSTPFPGIHHALAKERKVSNTKIGWGGVAVKDKRYVLQGQDTLYSSQKILLGEIFRTQFAQNFRRLHPNNMN